MFTDHLVTNCDTEEHFNLLKNRDEMYNNLPKHGSWIFALCDNNERRYFFVKNVEKSILSNIINQEIDDDTIIHLHVLKKYHLVMFTYIPSINYNANYNFFDANSYTENMENLWLPLVSFYKNHRNVIPDRISR